MFDLQILACAVMVCQAAGQMMSPCSSYTLLDNPKRSTAYEMTSSDMPIQDYYIIVEGSWYRFQYYGTDVELAVLDPGEMVPTRHCGTQSPIWINGTDAITTDYTVAERTVCSSYGLTSCDWSEQINITKCGLNDPKSAYYVYQLARPIAPKFAYCAGQEMPCASDQTYNATMGICVDMTSTTSSTITTRSKESTRRSTTTPSAPSTSTLWPHPAAPGMPTWLIIFLVAVCCFSGGVACMWYSFAYCPKNKRRISPEQAYRSDYGYEHMQYGDPPPSYYMETNKISGISQVSHIDVPANGGPFQALTMASSKK